MTSDTTLATMSLSTGYSGKVIAQGIDLTLRRGDVCAMLGRNGAGKSTLIKTITREIPPLAGSVELLGKPLAGYTPKALARTLSLVSTGQTQAGALTVRKLVALGRQPYTGLLGRLSGHDSEIVDESMRLVGITHKADDYVASLSDGERQKALIARALAQHTPMMVLDEPFSFLDVASRIEILSLLKNVAAARGTTILFSSHDVAQALRMADRLILFTPGGRVVQGDTSALVASGAVSDIFCRPGVRFDPSQNDFIEDNIPSSPPSMS